MYLSQQASKQAKHKQESKQASKQASKARARKQASRWQLSWGIDPQGHTGITGGEPVRSAMDPALCQYEAWFFGFAKLRCRVARVLSNQGGVAAGHFAAARVATVT